MQRKFFALLVLAILVIPAMGAAAPPRPGAYVAGFLGVTVPVDADVTTTQYGPGYKNYNDRVEYDPSLNIGGSGGYDFGFLRLEGELSYKNGEMSSLTERVSNTKYANVDGRVGVYSLMFNAFLDLRNPSPFTPYIGGGIGFATLYLDDTFGTNTSTGFRNRIYESDEDTVFAYQVGAGLEISLTQNFSLDLGYRYFGTAKGNFNRNTSQATELKFESHNASIGFRVKF
jgi:opacity protein-like surface antigen